MTLYYRGQEIELLVGEAVLDGLLRRGLNVPFSCRSGTCHVCAMRANTGEVPDAARRSLSPELQALGYFLPCKCVPTSDLELLDPSPQHLQIKAVVAEKVPLDDSLCIIRLELASNVQPIPGQHVVVVHPSGVHRPYSIAGLLDEDYFLELQVRRVPGGVVSNWLIDEVGVGDPIQLQRPTGSFAHRNRLPGQPMLLLGTGTGLAPLLAIARDALRDSATGEVWLFHGARDRVGLYANQQLRRLAETDARFHYFGCCSSEAVGAPYLHGRITDLVGTQLADLSGYKVFIAGHPSMVAAARDLCRDLGAKRESDILCDAFVHAHVGAGVCADVPAHALASTSSSLVPPPDPQLWAALDDGRVLYAVLRDFYAQVFVDQRLGPYFVGVTQQRLVEKQFSFLKGLITGTRGYFGQRPRNAHHWMVISDELFDYRLGIMQACLREHGVESRWIQRWHDYEEAFRGDIVKSKPIDRLVAGEVVVQDGFEETVIDCGTLCDACHQAIETGERVRFHLRLGTTFCWRCMSASCRAVAA